MLGSPTIKLLFAYIWHFPFNKHMLHILKSLIYASIFQRNDGLINISAGERCNSYDTCKKS